MSDGSLPGWVGDAADVLSLLSVPVTFWLGFQARRVRDYFFNRVRIEEILPELKREAAALFSNLRDWETKGENRSTILTISRIKGVLLNLKPKIQAEERKSAAQLIVKIEARRYYIWPRPASEVTLDEAWDIAAEYESLLALLTNSHNDSKWKTR